MSFLKYQRAIENKVDVSRLDLSEKEYLEEIRDYYRFKVSITEVIEELNSTIEEQDFPIMKFKL